MNYGPVFITSGSLILVFGGPALLWVALVMLEIGLVGFKLHLIKEAQRVGWIKTSKRIFTI